MVILRWFGKLLGYTLILLIVLLGFMVWIGIFGLAIATVS